MFVRKAGAFPSGAPKRSSSLVQTLTLPTNIRLGCKGLTETNTLAYESVILDQPEKTFQGQTSLFLRGINKGWESKDVFVKFRPAIKSINLVLLPLIFLHNKLECLPIKSFFSYKIEELPEKTCVAQTLQLILPQGKQRKRSVFYIISQSVHHWKEFSAKSLNFEGRLKRLDSDKRSSLFCRSEKRLSPDRAGARSRSGRYGKLAPLSGEWLRLY